MKNEHSLDLPRRHQIEFSKIVQTKTDDEGGEVTAEQLWHIFEDEYLPTDSAPWGRFRLKGMSQVSVMGEDVQLTVKMTDRGEAIELAGTGNGPIAAFCHILQNYGVDVPFLISVSMHSPQEEMHQLLPIWSAPLQEKSSGESESTLIQRLPHSRQSCLQSIALFANYRTQYVCPSIQALSR